MHLLTQSLEKPTTKQEQQLHRVLRYLAGTLHYTVSLHTTNQIAKEKAKNLELVAFSASSWTGSCRTSTAYLILWGVPLIASCKTSYAYKQEDAELEPVKLALGLARYTRNFLQQLDMDQLGKDVHIGLRTSSFNEELVTGRPKAMQLGLSRRNKHIQLRGQLQLSRVHPDKNLAQSLTNNASGERVLAKLRVNTGAAETVALPTVHSFASFVLSSSLLVGMVNLEPPKMESLQLRQLALSQSETCIESLSKNLADKSLASLTLPSLSLQRSNLESLTLNSWSFPIDSLTLLSLSRTRDRFHSLTLHSLSVTRGNLESLILQSLSLIAQNRFQRMSFRELIFGTGSLKEPEETLAHKLANRRAETNSFSRNRFEKDQLAAKEAKTNSFWPQSFRKRILSLRVCLQILLRSFQLTCAALLLGTGSFRESLPNQSLQQEELQAAYFRDSLQEDELEIACSQSPTRANQLQHHSLKQIEFERSSFQRLSDQLCRNKLESFNQLDLKISLSLTWFGSTRLSYQLQADSFDRSSFELRASPCAALLQTPRIRNRQVQSFQLTRVQLSHSLAQGGVHRASSKPAWPPPAWPTRALSTASTLTSLSFANQNWLNPSKRAWTRRSLLTRSSSRTASTSASPTTSTTTTSSLQRTFLFLMFSFVIANNFISSSFWKKSLRSTMSFHKLFNLVRLVPFMTILDKKSFAQISLSKTTSRRRTRTTSLITITFRKNKFQTENFSSFIFHNFMIKINLSEAQSSFQRKNALHLVF